MDDRIEEALEAMNGDARKLKIAAETFSVPVNKLRRAFMEQARQTKLAQHAPKSSKENATEWTSLTRLTAYTGQHRGTLRARFKSSLERWAHYETREATQEDRKRLKAYTINHVHRIVGDPGPRQTDERGTPLAEQDVTTSQREKKLAEDLEVAGSIINQLRQENEALLNENEQLKERIHRVDELAENNRAYKARYQELKEELTRATQKQDAA